MNAYEVSPEVALRLAGLTDGEGCFFISTRPRNRYCAFIIKLRLDDRPVLERMRDALGGIGTIRVSTGRDRQSPTAFWEVRKKAELALIRDLFELYPLWSKKQRDFRIWVRAVDFWLYGVGGGTDWTPLVEAKAELQAARRFDAKEHTTSVCIQASAGPGRSQRRER